MMTKLSKSQANHLRLLIGWIRCEIGEAPDEYLKTLVRVAGPLVESGYVPDEGAEKRLREGFEASRRVPKYVRAAVKALDKLSYNAPDDDEINPASIPHELKALGSGDDV